jgi:hypothetical protein
MEFMPSPAQHFRQGSVYGWTKAGSKLADDATPTHIEEMGWDHEHCELCQSKIGRGGDARRSRRTGAPAVPGRGSQRGSRPEATRQPCRGRSSPAAAGGAAPPGPRPPGPPPHPAGPPPRAPPAPRGGAGGAPLLGTDLVDPWQSVEEATQRRLRGGDLAQVADATRQGERSHGPLLPRRQRHGMPERTCPSAVGPRVARRAVAGRLNAESREDARRILRPDQETM